MFIQIVTSILTVYIMTIALLRPPVRGGHGHWLKRLTPAGLSMVGASALCICVQVHGAVVEKLEKDYQEESARFHLGELYAGLNMIERNTRNLR